MINREIFITNIINHLGVLKSIVGLRGKQNLLDINIHAETFYKNLLNLIYDYNLENINIVESNVAVIDLADAKERIAIQVTSNDSIKKIRETAASFNSKELYKKYDVLKILVIKDKTRRTGQITSPNFTFDMSQDVVDINDIIAVISDIKDVNLLKNIEDYIEQEVVLKYYKNKKKSNPNEVTHFIDLMEILSKEENYQFYEIEDSPDPELKFESRFKEYSSRLKDLYVDLLSEYGYALSYAENNEVISITKIRKIGLYLKDVSRKALKLSEGNPDEALDNLCEHFKKFLTDREDGYDDMAIKFYLIHQMIKCNVFPN